MEDIFSGYAPAEHRVKLRREPRFVWSAPAIRIVIAVAVSLLSFGVIVVKPILDGKISGWTPSIGDCVTGAQSDADVKNVKRVDCDSLQAAYKVIGVFKSRDEAEFEGSDNPCFQVAGSVESIFYGRVHNGFILCLAAN